MEWKDILFEVSDGVALITVNRPEQMNAMTNSLRQELIEAFRLINESNDIKAVILTGKGDKAFIAGAEIRPDIDSPIIARDDAQIGQYLTNMIERLPKPVIAAVNGAAMGGGLEIILSCDLCIASEKALLGLPEVKLGLIPGWGGTQRVTRTTGKKGAMQLVLLGEPVTAQEAYRLGLVNKVVPGEQLMDEALILAKKMIRNSPFAMAQAKKAVLAGMEIPLGEGLEFERELEGTCFDCHDVQEGVKAFLEKRTPNFTGKPGREIG